MKKYSEWISCKNAPNLISEWVGIINPLQIPGAGIVDGLVIDQDEHAFSVRFAGVTWNVRQVKKHLSKLNQSE